MSLTFINLEESPDHRKFGLGSGLLEDFLHNPLDQLRTLKWDKTSGSWDLDKIRGILIKINEMASHKNHCPEPIKMQQAESEEVYQSSDFDKQYDSFKNSEKYDNRKGRVQQILRDFKNRVIYKQQRPSSVQPKVINKPQKCKLVSKIFEEKLNTIEQKYGRRPSTTQAKSKYMDHFSIDTNRQKTILTEVVRPYTCQSARRGYSLQREKTFDLDKRVNYSAQISKRRKSTLDIERKKQSAIGKLMRKCEKELNRKVDMKKYDLENYDIQPTFMLDDSDGQIKKLSKCINFDPINSIKHEFRMHIPKKENTIAIAEKLSLYKKRLQNIQKQKVFCVKAQNFEED